MQPKVAEILTRVGRATTTISCKVLVFKKEVSYYDNRNRR